MEDGQIVGSYTITRKLGEGGMGAVFLAYDTTLHRPVALKFIAHAADTESSRSRLLREARNAAALNHPNICTIHEVNHEGGTAFIAMEYVEGRSLRDAIDDTGALPKGDVLRFAIQMADALAYAHEHGVVHRDLKAANVMIAADGRLKIVDFGLARRDDALITDATTLASVVHAGSPAGTPYAMSPEQVRGEPADARSDVWALGVLLYEMLTGTKPFASASVPELFSAILKEPPRAWPSAVSPALRGVVERCLEKDPSRRYQRARDVQLVLEAIQSGSTPVWTTWRYRLARPAWLVAAALVSTVAALAVLLNLGGVGNRFAGRDSGSIKLAVLPFENLTGDPAQDYFSDGLTDDMITRLGRLHPARLRVIARSSSTPYKDHRSTRWRASWALTMCSKEVRGARSWSLEVHPCIALAP
jgi:eukaryotic-like serine/threonine-protein kinase